MARHIRISPSVTSYEIVCATARSEPISAYFELDDHPDHRIVNTVMLDTAIMKISPRFMLIIGDGIGIGVHISMANVRASIGLIINIVFDESVG